MQEFFVGNIRGPKGDTGNGLTIKEFYATTEELNANVSAPSVGDAYGVGEEGAYEIYIYSATKGWVNSGAFQPDINDQAPNYEEATTLESLSSGEKISIAFGKIKKAIKELIAHLKDSVKHITSAERTKWDNAEPFKVTVTEQPAGSNRYVSDKTVAEIMEAYQLGRNVFLDLYSYSFQLSKVTDLVASFTNIDAQRDENGDINDLITGHVEISNKGTVTMGLANPPITPSELFKVTISEEESDRTPEEIFLACKEGKLVYATRDRDDFPYILSMASETTSQFQSVCLVNDEDYGDLNVITYLKINEDGSVEIKETFPIGAEGGIIWGEVHATTPEENTNNTQIATTEYVDRAVRHLAQILIP